MAEVRRSSRQASRKARYSVLLKMRGDLFSYLGWVTWSAGLLSMWPWFLR